MRIAAKLMQNNRYLQTKCAALRIAMGTI